MRNKAFRFICFVIFFFMLGSVNLFAADKASLEKEVVKLKEENALLSSERAGMYEELGIAYTKAGLLDEAIDAYKKSLFYNPNNAQIHYYLGLLYQKTRKDVEKAVSHFKRYLYLNPDAKNKDEVRYLIEMVQNKR